MSVWTWLSVQLFFSYVGLLLRHGVCFSLSYVLYTPVRNRIIIICSFTVQLSRITLHCTILACLFCMSELVSMWEFLDMGFILVKFCTVTLEFGNMICATRSDGLEWQKYFGTLKFVHYFRLMYVCYVSNKISVFSIQCLDAVGWATGRASSL